MREGGLVPVLRRVALLVALGVTVHGVSAAQSTPKPDSADEPPPRTLLFGDLHVHSGWSFDAYAAGVTLGPNYAYRYARGEPIPHYSGREIRLAGPPLDFMALTDHAEYLGVIQASQASNHPLQRQPIIHAWRQGEPGERKRAWRTIFRSYRSREGFPALLHDSVVKPIWRTLVGLANRENRPGEFTALIGFEYTSNPEGQNLHRNVLFRGDDAPKRPFSSMDSERPEDLWRWMDEVRAQGHAVLAIPHNANGSNGRMFATTRSDGIPIDADWARLRARNEPVAEVFQIKGQSETHPQLSPGDPWANFEIIDKRTTRPDLASKPPGSYVRDALKRGLALEAKLGENPFALGMVGSTDGHNAASPFEESNYTGKIGNSDPTAEARLGPDPRARPEKEPVVTIAMRWGAAGLAGVWTESNTRAAIFDALRRRETFATSGTRIRIRLLAGWDFTPKDAEGELAAPALGARGVPMGGVLVRPQDVSGGPTFLLAAQRDPLGANLERVQVVKGWLEDGIPRERVFDVACAGGVTPDPTRHRCALPEAPPDLETCRPAEDAGSPELRTFWRDPDATPTRSAFYYVRVLEIPTCRWSTWDANRLSRPVPKGLPAWIQERAVTSPVWIGPSTRSVPSPPTS